MQTPNPTPFDYAISLPVSPRAQLAWLYVLQCLAAGQDVPSASDVAAKLDICQRSAYGVLRELIDAGELLRQAPGVMELAA